MRATSATVDPEEIDRFAAQAEAWWDPEGSFRALHRINPTRLGFIRQHLTAHFRRDRSSLRPFDGLTLLDIGCGGGLIAEPMARLGFHRDRYRRRCRSDRRRSDACRGNGSSDRLSHRRPRIDRRGRRALRRRAGARGDRARRRSRRFLGIRRRPGQARRRLHRRYPQPHPPISLPWRSSAPNTSSAGCPAARMIGASLCVPRNSSSDCAAMVSLATQLAGVIYDPIRARGMVAFAGPAGQLHGRRSAAVTSAFSCRSAGPTECGQS